MVPVVGVGRTGPYRPSCVLSSRIYWAYRRRPQTDAEFGYVDIGSIASLAELPWEG